MTSPSCPPEALSALIDGQCTAQEAQSYLDELLPESDAVAAQNQWHCYQLIGDVLRDARLAPAPQELVFLDRLRPALRQVQPASASGGAAAQGAPTVLLNSQPPELELSGPDPANSDSRHESATPVVIPGQDRALRHAANEEVFRWRWVAGVAIVALVLGVGGLLSNVSDVPAPAVLAGAPMALAPTGVIPQQASADSQESMVMVRDPELDALLMAHQQMAGNSALQAPSGFLRNATFERSSR